ncbi:MAG: alpha/beta hydrolase, partial [Rhizobacter sp.]|nr:alpha/beta hydrolase [Rhizobacter sp.]
TLPAGGGPAQRRAHFETIAKAMRQPTPAGVSTTDEHQVPVPGMARSVRVRLFRPAGEGPRPALIYMHGGAWMQGSPETHWDITAGIAATAGQVVISVDYALAPEHPFPAAVDDCRAVVEWAFDDAQALGLQRDAIAIGGDSAGANLATVQALSLRGTSRQLRAQLLVYPGVDFSLDRDSHRENADGPIITVASMPMVNAMYCPNPKDLLDWRAAPLLAPSHAGMPPAFIAVAEHDPLRDEGIAYAEALRADGVAVQLDRGPGA